MTQDNTYNGWTNYATWRVNLEIIDSLGPEEFDLPRGEALKSVALYDIADAFKERAEYYIEQQATGLAEAYALAFLAEVNWREIARHFVEAYAD